MKRLTPIAIGIAVLLSTMVLSFAASSYFEVIENIDGTTVTKLSEDMEIIQNLDGSVDQLTFQITEKYADPGVTTRWKATERRLYIGDYVLDVPTVKVTPKPGQMITSQITMTQDAIIQAIRDKEGGLSSAEENNLRGAFSDPENIAIGVTIEALKNGIPTGTTIDERKSTSLDQQFKNMQSKYGFSSGSRNSWPTFYKNMEKPSKTVTPDPSGGTPSNQGLRPSGIRHRSIND